MSTNPRKFQYQEGEWKERRLLTAEEHRQKFPRWNYFRAGFFVSAFLMLSLGVASATNALPKNNTWLYVMLGSLVTFYGCLNRVVAEDPRSKHFCVCDPNSIPDSLRLAIEQNGTAATITVDAKVVESIADTSVED
jgi:cytochrome c biogenesis protein CcdA